MDLDAAVRSRLLSAGFSESENGSDGFELYESSDTVVVLHVQGDITKEERLGHIEQYRSVLSQQFDATILDVALKVSAKKEKHHDHLVAPR